MPTPRATKRFRIGQDPAVAAYRQQGTEQAVYVHSPSLRRSLGLTLGYSDGMGQRSPAPVVLSR